MTHTFNLERQTRLYRHKKPCYLLCEDTKTATLIKDSNIRRQSRYRLPKCIICNGLKYTITRIEIGALKKSKRLRSLIIPDNIEFVDEDSISCFPNLKRIYIGKNLHHVSSWMFGGTNKLYSVIIDKGNRHLKIEKGIVYTFDGKCTLTTPFKPKQLKVKTGVEIINTVAFWFNDKLESVSFPSTLKTIKDNALSHCSRLKEIILPEGLDRCEVQCFQNNISLESVDLPSTIQHLGFEVFYNCPSLKTLIIRTHHVLSPTTYDLNDFVFLNNCTLYVPEKLVFEYQNNPIWSQCKSIMALTK